MSFQVRILECSKLPIPALANALDLEPEQVIFSGGGSRVAIPLSVIARVQHNGNKIGFIVARSEVGLVAFEVVDGYFSIAGRTASRVAAEIQVHRDRLRQRDGRHYVRCPRCADLIDRSGLPDGVRLHCYACKSYVEPAGARGATALHIASCPECSHSRPLFEYSGGQVISFFIATRWQETKYTTCPPCARSKAFSDLLVSGVAGWWGFPWGFFLTPVFIVRNMYIIGSSFVHGRHAAPSESAALTTGSVDVACVPLDARNHPGTQYTMGCSLLESGDARAALEYFTFVTRACPNHADAWAKLADLHFKHGDFAKARDDAAHAARDPMYRQLNDLIVTLQPTAASPPAAPAMPLLAPGPEDRHGDFVIKTVSDVGWRTGQQAAQTVPTPQASPPPAPPWSAPPATEAWTRPPLSPAPAQAPSPPPWRAPLPGGLPGATWATTPHGSSRIDKSLWERARPVLLALLVGLTLLAWWMGL